MPEKVVEILRNGCKFYCRWEVGQIYCPNIAYELYTVLCRALEELEKSDESDA